MWEQQAVATVSFKAAKYDNALIIVAYQHSSGYEVSIPSHSSEQSLQNSHHQAPVVLLQGAKSYLSVRLL